MSKLITVIGAGHLAKFFFQTLEKDWKVLALTRSPEKIQPTSLVHVQKYLTGEVLPSTTLLSEVVLWSLPPLTNYLDVLKSADQQFPAQCQWIFISSTSVFGTGQIDESSPYLAQTENARVLIECEKYLHAIKKTRKVTILRPGGLVDQERHPRNFFARASSLSAADTNVNLVHTIDVARSLSFLISNNLLGEDFNLVSDDHPTKREFYLPLVTPLNPRIQVDTNNSVERIICNAKIKQLGFQFKYPTIQDCFN